MPKRHRVGYRTNVSGQFDTDVYYDEFNCTYITRAALEAMMFALGFEVIEDEDGYEHLGNG